MTAVNDRAQDDSAGITGLRMRARKERAQDDSAGNNIAPDDGATVVGRDVATFGADREVTAV
jgi:hypothetical protein